MAASVTSSKPPESPSTTTQQPVQRQPSSVLNDNSVPLILSCDRHPLSSMQSQVKVRMSAQVIKTHGPQSTQHDLVTSVCVLSCQRAIRQHQEKIAILLGPIRVTDSHPWIALPYGVYFLQHGAVIYFPSILVVELSSTSRQNTRNVPIPDTNESEAFTQFNKAATIVPADAGQDPNVVVCRYGSLSQLHDFRHRTRRGEQISPDTASLVNLRKAGVNADMETNPRWQQG